MENIDISVIIPVYNVETYLAECLNSVLLQRGPHIEVICVNDGSTDGSMGILQMYAEENPSVKIVQQNHLGPAVARNVGIDHALGRYLVFLDSDDMLQAGALDKLWRLAEELQLEMVSFETLLFYEEASLHLKAKDRYYTKRHSYSGIRSGNSYLTEMLRNEEFIDSACLLFLNRHWLTRSGIRFIEGILYEDSMFSAKCYFNAKRMLHLPDQLYIYRVRKHSVMTSIPTFHNVYSRMVNYREATRLLQDIPEQEKEFKEGWAGFVEKIVHSIPYLENGRMDAEFTPQLEPEYRVLSRIFSVGKQFGVGRQRPQMELLLAGMEKIVADSPGVVLYGAGDIGMLLLSFLSDKGLRHKVAGFAVTDPSDAAEQVMSIPVRGITEYRESGYLILISAGLKIREEMEGTVERLGFPYYLGLDLQSELALRCWRRRKRGMLY